MFRTCLMTVLAVVAIGFGAVSTAEAGDFAREYLTPPPWGAVKNPGRQIYVTNECVDNLPVYTHFFGNPLRVYPWNLDLQGFLELGARPVTPGPIGIKIQNLLESDGLLCVVGGSNGDKMVLLPVTLNPYPSWNIFRVTGTSTDPVVTRR
jgi:hypothetical protein